MPAYSFTCLCCHTDFELFALIKDYEEHPKCKKCKSKKTERRYIEDLLTLNTSVKKSDSELKTLGDLANRNRDRLSDDQKRELSTKHNLYRENTPSQDLPSGMSRMKKQPKVKWTNNETKRTNKRTTR